MAAPFGVGNNIAGGVPGVPGYVDFFKVAYSDDIRLKSMRLEHPLLNIFEREALNGAPLVIRNVKKVDEGYGITDSDTTGGTSTLKQNRDRVAQLDYQSVPVESRTVMPNFWNFAALYDPRDSKALMRDVRPDSNFQRSILGSFGRKMESIILDGLLGDVSVASGAAPVTTSFFADGGHMVGAVSGEPDAYDGGTGNGLQTAGSAGAALADVCCSTEKLLDARSKLELSDAVMPGDRLIAIMSPRQMRLFMANDPQVVNFDFNRDKPLAQGIVSDWLGMDFIVTTAVQELPAFGVVAGTGTNPDTWVTDEGPGVQATGSVPDPFDAGRVNATGEFIYVTTRDAMMVGMDAVETRFDIIPERGHSLQVAHYASIGTVRLEGTKVCAIQCYNA